MIRILKYIHEHIREPLLAADSAAQFGYSRWYFCSCFKQYTGRTFVEYVRHCRVQLAALEILSGAKVADVALAYGYDSIGGFNKAFLKEFGCSPTEYRKQAKESQLYYEERRTSMFPLSDRCAALREDAVNQKAYLKYYAVQRNVYYTLGQSEAAAEGKSRTEMVARGIVRTLESFTPVIRPGELIVGFNFGDAAYGEYFFPEDNAVCRQLMRDNAISEEDIAAYFAPPVPDPNPRVDPDVTEEELRLRSEWAVVGRGIDSNHTVLGYEKVLKRGFAGLLEDIAQAKATVGESPMYTAMEEICVSAMKMGEKYAQKAKELLDSGDETFQRKDLETIIAICNRVPRYPATTFLEAVQSLFFAHIVNTWEDFVNANSLGRLDQILYPYYKADIDKGILTKEQAAEILCCLWIKLYRDYDVQQSCVGGTTPDGKSAVNDLSRLMLDVTEQLDFVRCLSVRYSAVTERDFLKRALEVVGHVQKGVPFFFNDDVMIPALMAKGIAREDAYDYT